MEPGLCLCLAYFLKLGFLIPLLALFCDGMVQWRGLRAIPMEVNMPLAITMLLDWNPTGPGKKDTGRYQLSYPYQLGDEQVIGIPGHLYQYLSVTSLSTWCWHIPD